MNVSLDSLERKVDQIVAVCASLRGENQALRAHGRRSSLRASALKA
jgi:hypothetical protein